MSCKCSYILLYWNQFANSFINFITFLFLKFNFEWYKETKYMVKYTFVIYLLLYLTSITRIVKN